MSEVLNQPKPIESHTSTPPSVATLIDERYITDKQGNERLVVKLTQEGKAQITAEFNTHVLGLVNGSSNLDMNQIVANAASYDTLMQHSVASMQTEVANLRKKLHYGFGSRDDVRRLTDMELQLRYLRLKRSSFKKRIDIQQKMGAKEKVFATPSIYSKVAENLAPTLYPQLSAKQGQTIVKNRLVNTRFAIEQTTQALAQSGQISQDEINTTALSYERQITKAMLAKRTIFSKAELQQQLQTSKITDPSQEMQPPPQTQQAETGLEKKLDTALARIESKSRLGKIFKQTKFNTTTAAWVLRASAVLSPLLGIGLPVTAESLGKQATISSSPLIFHAGKDLSPAAETALNLTINHAPKTHIILPKNRIGIRVNSALAVNAVESTLGVKNIRVSLNAATAENGTFTTPTTEAILTQTDKDKVAVDATYNPDHIQGNETTLQTAAGINHHEKEVRAQIKQSLIAVLSHPSVKFLEIGNEPNLNNWPKDPHAFWHGDLRSFARFVRLTLDELSALKVQMNRSDVEVIFPAIANANENPFAFRKLIQALKSEGVDVAGQKIAYHAYSEAAQNAGIAQIRGAGGSPVATELNTYDKNPRLLAKLIQQAETSTDNNFIYIHEYDGQKDWLGNQLAIAGTPLQSVVKAATHSPSAIRK